MSLSDAALASEASGQRGNSPLKGAPDTRPKGLSARSRCKVMRTSKRDTSTALGIIVKGIERCSMSS